MTIEVLKLIKQLIVNSILRMKTKNPQSKCHVCSDCRDCTRTPRFQLELLCVGLKPCLCVCVHNQVKDCLDHSAVPMDGTSLTEALHQRGINVRYLGTVLEFVEKTPAKAQMEHIYVSLIPQI